MAKREVGNVGGLIRIEVKQSSRSVMESLEKENQADFLGSTRAHLN